MGDVKIVRSFAIDGLPYSGKRFGKVLVNWIVCEYSDIIVDGPLVVSLHEDAAFTTSASMAIYSISTSHQLE